MTQKVASSVTILEVQKLKFMMRIITHMHRHSRETVLQLSVHRRQPFSRKGRTDAVRPQKCRHKQPLPLFVAYRRVRRTDRKSVRSWHVSEL